jgi:D-cysteine desulfhydrase
MKIHKEIPMIPLFSAYPNLQNNLPHLPIGSFPTPVEKLDGLCRTLGTDGLFVKRDDVSGRIYGGNKVRKLEFLLADALRQKAVRVITTGAAGSNHALATALYAKAAGLKATLALFEQPPSPVVRDNLLMDAFTGADMVYEERFGRLAARFGDIVKHYEDLDGRAPYVIPAGGSSALGAVGYVNAAFELKEQIGRGELPEPAAIYLPVGTMGTAAGLMLGLRAAGVKSSVVPVRVAPAEVANSERFAQLFTEIAALLRGLDPSFPARALAREETGLSHDYFEPGYGVASQEVVAMVALAERTDGLHLDTTYSGKAFAAFVAAAHAAPGPLLFWNTKNSRALPNEALALDYRVLPAPLHRYFEEL